MLISDFVELLGFYWLYIQLISRERGVIQSLAVQKLGLILDYIVFHTTFIDVRALRAVDLPVVSFISSVVLILGFILIALFNSKARNRFKYVVVVRVLNRIACTLNIAAVSDLKSKS